MMPLMKLTAPMLPGVLMACAAGCFAPPPSVKDPDPASKIPAIKIAVAKNDHRVLPQLVEDLDNDDPAVRFYALDGLEKFSGQSFGYHYYDEADARKPAIERWKQWLAQQPKS